MSQLQALVPQNSTIDRSLIQVPATLRRFFGLAGRRAPELTARWAAQRFLTIRRHRMPPRERQWLATARRFDPVVAGRRLAVWCWGEGPTVLLVHGWEGRGSQMGAFAGPLAARGFRVVTFDAPGHGASQGRLSSLVEMAEAISGLVARLGGVHGVVAHSAGAAAATIALGAGARVERAVYLAPPADLGRFARRMARILGLPPEVPRRMQERIERHFGVRWDALAGPAIAPRLTQPLLTFHDLDDLEVPWREGERVAGAWPQARLVTTQGLGHRRILRDFGVIYQAVGFLAADLGLHRSIERELEVAAEELAAALLT